LRGRARREVAGISWVEGWALGSLPELVRRPRQTFGLPWVTDRKCAICLTPKPERLRSQLVRIERNYRWVPLGRFVRILLSGCVAAPVREAFSRCLVAHTIMLAVRLGSWASIRRRLL